MGFGTHWLTSMIFQEASFPIITGFLTRSSLDGVRQHMAPENRDQQISEKAKRRASEKSEKANRRSTYVGTFTRGHIRTFARVAVIIPASGGKGKVWTRLKCVGKPK